MGHYVNFAPLRTPGGGDRSELSGKLLRAVPTAEKARMATLMYPDIVALILDSRA